MLRVSTKRLHLRLHQQAHHPAVCRLLQLALSCLTLKRLLHGAAAEHAQVAAGLRRAAV